MVVQYASGRGGERYGRSTLHIPEADLARLLKSSGGETMVWWVLFLKCLLVTLAATGLPMTKDVPTVSSLFPEVNTSSSSQPWSSSSSSSSSSSPLPSLKSFSYSSSYSSHNSTIYSFPSSLTSSSSSPIPFSYSLSSSSSSISHSPPLPVQRPPAQSSSLLAPSSFKLMSSTTPSTSTSMSPRLDSSRSMATGTSSLVPTAVQNDQHDLGKQDDQREDYHDQYDQEEEEEEEEEEDDDDDPKFEPPQPHLAAANTSVKVYLGATARLDCVVHDLNNESVSWLRHVDDKLELLTWDSYVYANDPRYSLVPETGDKWRRWQLVVRDSQLDDQGQYRCQVAIQPPLLHSVTLTVIEPRARVVDERGTDVEEKYYNSGSMIELKCIIDRVPFPHGPVTWRRGTTILAFNTSRGGISVRGQPTWGFVRSRLYVANASPADSGVYVCSYSNYTSDTVTVHVIAGENSAAMQHDALPDTSSSSDASFSMTQLLQASHLYHLAAICLATWVTS
ncbi:uncharacterized protein [Panulirus ornatus]|uniref:uncharacterized protein isoform X2 n=1 Tax=Panulirus ornatus TaxID=150431 RepID=UPI003A89DF00